MSIFITNLAFADPTLILLSKAGILVASLLAGFTGYVILRFSSTT
jgi:NhaA family Na+:H+ antiporter